MSPSVSMRPVGGIDSRVRSTVLDIIVLWHAQDVEGAEICDMLMDHYHSARFSGFAGSAVEVYGHSLPFPDGDGAPAPIVTACGIVGADTGERFADPAPYTVILPFIGENLVRAACDPTSVWFTYLESLLELRDKARDGDESGVLIIPALSTHVPDYANCPLVKTLMGKQGVGIGSLKLGEPAPAGLSTTEGALFRDLGQTVVQSLLGLPGGKRRLSVFISHSRDDVPGEDRTGTIPTGAVAMTRAVIRDTHLRDFVDVHDIQVGDDWDRTIREEAGSGALLMVRTDHYSGREWTQWEVLSAKQAGIPVVSLVALVNGEERGSFLLDHIPTLPYTPVTAQDRRPSEQSIVRALNRLVDETLKHALWSRQPIPKEVARRKELAANATAQTNDDYFDVAPPNAPEPLMLTEFLSEHQRRFPDDRAFWLLHPDPPLLPPEHTVMTALCALSRYDRNQVHLLTPRTYLAGGGSLDGGAPHLSGGNLLEDRPLANVTLGVSMARSSDLGALGLRETHLSLVIAEVAQVLLLAGGAITYAGAIGTHVPDLTESVVDTINRYVEAATLEAHRRFGSKGSSGERIHPGKMFHLTPPCVVLRSAADIDRLTSVSKGSCSTGDISVLDERGGKVALEDAAPWVGRSGAETAEALTAIRKALPEYCHARLVIGGKTIPRSEDPSGGYLGDLPGIVEEALYTVRAEQPLYVAGGFGGAGAVLAHELGLGAGLPVAQESLDAIARTTGYAEAIEEIREGFDPALTGLDGEDLRVLASTRRACDLAGLVVKGMSARWAAEGGGGARPEGVEGEVIAGGEARDE